MAGLIGFSSGYYAMLDCDVSLPMLGTDFPVPPVLSAWRGSPIAQGTRGPKTSADARQSTSRCGGRRPRHFSMRLLSLIEEKGSRSHLDQATQHYRKARKKISMLSRLAQQASA